MFTIKQKNIFTDTIDTVSNATKNVTDTYDNHIREKAIKMTNKKIESVGVKISDIDENDYEAMVSDASKDIQSEYNKRIAQAGLSLLGLDLLFGVLSV